jgi:hypothetical protein
MTRLGSIAALAMVVCLAACDATIGPSDRATGGVGQPEVVATPAASTGIVLRQAPADMGCDTIGWEGEPYRTLTFHVDPDAAEQVWAESDTGASLTSSWSAGFQPGTAEERLVRDPQGQVFISDGEIVEVPEAANLRIHGYLVCLRPDELWVLTNESG